MGDLLGFLLAGVALAGSPGPANLSLAGAGAAFGARRCAGYAAGIVLGVLAVLTIAATGIAGLVLAVPALRAIVALLAAAYILRLAWRIATAPAAGSNVAARPPSFVGGVFLTLSNPKAYASMTALASGFTLIPGAPMIDLAGKAAALSPILLVVVSGWLLLGTALARLVARPRTHRVVSVGFAMLLLASVILAVL